MTLHKYIKHNIEWKISGYGEQNSEQFGLKTIYTRLDGYCAYACLHEFE